MTLRFIGRSGGAFRAEILQLSSSDSFRMTGCCGGVGGLIWAGWSLNPHPLTSEGAAPKGRFRGNRD
jgi:hypothetical protein